MGKRVILASSSPRREELLKTILKDFIIIKPFCNEVELYSPICSCTENAKKKAYAIKRHKNDIIIGCDTVVAMDNIQFGKPYTREKAIEMLLFLRNKWHSVFTGVCIISDEEYCYTEESKVFIKNMSVGEIEKYVDTYSPFDKAGSYGIQDSVVVKEYRGEYSNIVGLPLKKLYRILLENGINVEES